MQVELIQSLSPMGKLSQWVSTGMGFIAELNPALDHLYLVATGCSPK